MACRLRELRVVVRKVITQLRVQAPIGGERAVNLPPQEVEQHYRIWWPLLAHVKADLCLLVQLLLAGVERTWLDPSQLPFDTVTVLR